MDQKTEIQGVYRAESGALINKDNQSLEAYKKKKAQTRVVSDLQIQVKMLTQRIEALEKKLENR